MTTLVIEPVESPGLDAKLEGWAERIAAVGGVFDAIRADFHAVEARRFADEGPGWAPLAPSTVLERQRLGYGGEHPILHRTGLLSGSLTSDGPGSVTRVDPDVLFIGTDVPYAHWHQTGGTKPGRPPKRVLVDVDGPTRARWVALVASWIGGTDITVTVPGGPR